MFDQVLDQIYQAGRWLNGTDLHTSIRHLLQTVGWVSPTIQSIHIVCITLVIGTAALLDLRAAIEQEELPERQQQLAQNAEQKNKPPGIALRHRALPFMQMLEACQRQGDSVMWGV